MSMKIILSRDVTMFCIVDICLALEQPSDFIFWVLEKQNYAIRF